jgi:GTP-binding protein
MTSPFDVIEADFLAAAVDEASMPPPALFEVAFAGRSNVGKSSMMNALVQRKGLVRTSSTPGCTRSVNVFHARTRGGLDLQLVDLPGYGFAKRSKAERIKWGPLLENYLTKRPTLRMVVVIIDARRGVEEDDEQLIQFCALPRPGNAPVSTIVVATKLDLLPKAKRKPTIAALRKASGLPVIGFSAHAAGENEESGREEVMRAIERAMTQGTA